MSKRKPVEESPVAAAWRDTLTGAQPKERIGGVSIQGPPGFASRTVALEDLHPLVMDPENYDSELLCEVVVQILGELEHRTYVDQTFENDLNSFYFGTPPRDLQATLLEDLAHTLVALDHLGVDLNDHKQFSQPEEWLAERRVSVPAAPAEKPSILEEAMNIVNGARRNAYGHPENNFKRIADLWNAYLEGKPGEEKLPITCIDVSLLMVLMKVARLLETPTHRDSAIDLAGYAATLEMLWDGPQ